MSTPSKVRDKKSNGRKKRHSDEYHSPRQGSFLAAEFPPAAGNGHSITSNGHPRLSYKLASLIKEHGSEEELMGAVSALVESENVAEMEQLRAEVQHLKSMLNQATSVLQEMAHSGDLRPTNLMRRLQEDNKMEMDKLRQYFEKRCEQSQMDHDKEICALRSESQEVDQQRQAEQAKLRELLDTNAERVKILENENGDIMRRKVHHEQANSQLRLTLKKMEQDKLAGEERTKKILSAVRDGLHRLSDMKENENAPGNINNFYNHVEEVITTDDWGDDETYVKGVMEEIQVSVQKLARPARPTARNSANADDVEAVKAGYETRISDIHAEKKLLEISLTDKEQRVIQLTQKLEADKRYINEMSSEREAEREEMLKMTGQLEDNWRENEKLVAKIEIVQNARSDLEAQLKTVATHIEQAESAKQKLEQQLREKDVLLRHRAEVVSELERQLGEKHDQDLAYQTQLERIKMELSGFLKSPPPSSPEPQLDMSFTFEDLMKQVMDLKDELQTKYNATEAERAKQVLTLQQELEQYRRSQERMGYDRESWQQEMENKDIELADLRRQLDDYRFAQPNDDEYQDLQNRLRHQLGELDHRQQTIHAQNTKLAQVQLEMESLQDAVVEWRGSCEQLKEQNASVHENLLTKLGEFEDQNTRLLSQIEETKTVWDEQQKSWEEQVREKSVVIAELQNEVADLSSAVEDLESSKASFEESQRLLEQSETSLRDKTMQLQSLKNLVDIMKTESAQKDKAIKAVQEHGNDNSADLAERLKEVESLNNSLMQEVDVLRNAPQYSEDVWLSIREKDTEISNLRDLLEKSFDDVMNSPRKTDDRSRDILVQTDSTISVPVVEEAFQTSSTPELANMVHSTASQTHSADDAHDLLLRIADFTATIRELESALLQKDTQLNAMAVEIASLSDRHGKTQAKHRSTIRHLQTSSSSSDEGSVGSAPKSGMNSEAKKLVAQYEEKIREMDKQHSVELDRLVHESLQVLNQSQNSTLLADSSSRECSPVMESSGDSTILEGTVSETLQKALKELRNGSEAILKATAERSMNSSLKQNGHDNWSAEREVMVAKMDCFRETINQLILSRDSLESALRTVEQQNEDLISELDVLRVEDSMADQGKDLLLSLLKKTEAELGELQARYRQRDLRLEIEQAGREREEKEREKLQKDLRDTEVQLVRVRGELRTKEAQWERERILSMWKKETSKMEMDDFETERSPWKGRYLRAESYRKNLIHQKRYLVTLIDDVIVNTTDDFVKMLALDGIRPATMRAPGAVEWRRKSFRCVAVVVCATVRLRLTKISWAQRRNLG